MIYLCIAGRSRFAHLDVDYLWLASRDDRRAPNTWLSRQKPVLVWCPKCKKPLHRCSIWLFYLRAHKSLNGVQREHSQYPRSCMPTIGSGGGKSEGMEDLSGLTTLLSQLGSPGACGANSWSSDSIAYACSNRILQNPHIQLFVQDSISPVEAMQILWMVWETW